MGSLGPIINQFLEYCFHTLQEATAKIWFAEKRAENLQILQQLHGCILCIVYLRISQRSPAIAIGLFQNNIRILNFYKSIICILCLGVCLFVCPIITHEPLDRTVSSFDWGTRENYVKVLTVLRV